jgi:hypothetical protein
MFTNRRTYLLVLESTKIYIKIRIKMLLHVSVCDHHQGACIWDDDGRRPKYVGAFNMNFNVNFSAF